MSDLVKRLRGAATHIEREYRVKAADEIERLRAERDALKRDAERYRWLRAEHERFDPMANVVWKYRFDRESPEWVNCASAGSLDNGIDAAMKENSDE